MKRTIISIAIIGLFLVSILPAVHAGWGIGPITFGKQTPSFQGSCLGPPSLMSSSGTGQTICCPEKVTGDTIKDLYEGMQQIMHRFDCGNQGCNCASDTI